MSSFEDNDGVEDTFHDCIEPYSASEEHDVETENNLSGGEKNITEEETSLVENSQKDVNKALEYKNNGNEAFKNRDFDAAIQCYSMALSYCPEDDFPLLSTLYGNRSASYFAEEEFDLVIEDCSASLNAKPDYLKVLARRMQTYEKLEKFEEALADAKKLQELEPLFPSIRTIIPRLEKLQEEKMQRMKDEALGKLKELGNSILGAFGMSLDNFKMEQDPATGSWSVNMKR